MNVDAFQVVLLVEVGIIAVASLFGAAPWRR